MNLIGLVVLVVGAVVAFLLWLDWWLPQFTAGAGW